MKTFPGRIRKKGANYQVAGGSLASGTETK